ncbi:GntR family transcriptional regulator [Natranaerovirga pectinivora]|uniref:GntR family transcriptional regulator n=1 Tax=Natranaerovirga pectinivora TaxID=682400 RepID=A0A4R3MMB5_9FIRM|nr:GntR family transcriptional regulator [Natranaerovirga pectinivora]TCT13126.1 GntR family transcriptional regulator [Natranaerovirga pectinivora]
MGEPIYLAVKKELKNRIKIGVYKSGEQIPSERELSELFNISRMTARQAVNELVNEGLIKREKGRGSFVSSPQFLQKNIRSFTETLLEQGHEPSTKLIEFCTVYNLKEISMKLGEKPDTNYYKIKRLRFANLVPVALETVYIPKYRCEKLEDYDLETSLYNILEDYGYIIQSVSCNIDACLSSRPIMRTFDVSKPVTLLKVEGVNYTINGEKLFYEESYYRSNLYKYHVDINRR